MNKQKIETIPTLSKTCQGCRLLPWVAILFISQFPDSVDIIWQKGDCWRDPRQVGKCGISRQMAAGTQTLTNLGKQCETWKEDFELYLLAIASRRQKQATDLKSRLNRSEVMYKRENNLCFRCGEKYFVEHRKDWKS